jgi:hypothetical protein
LKLGVSTASLGAGSYSCSVAVSTSQPLVDSASHTVRVSLTLRATPRIHVSADTVSATAFRLSDATPASVAITNAGTGTLGGLSTGTIEYDAGGSGWLTARLDSATAPTSMTLTATARSLPAGTFFARVPVQTSAEGVANSPRSVVVRLSVAPRPSALVAVPAVTNVTVAPGGGVTVSITVTHSGDTPITMLGFGVISPIVPWFGATMGCTGAAFATPCTALITYSPPASPTPAVYSFVVPFTIAGKPGTSATVNINVR